MENRELAEAIERMRSKVHQNRCTLPNTRHISLDHTTGAKRIERTSENFTFRFFDLPREIRDLIYKKYLESETNMGMTNSQYREWQTSPHEPDSPENCTTTGFFSPWTRYSDRYPVSKNLRPQPPALWSASSQLREEAMEIHVKDFLALDMDVVDHWQSIEFEEVLDSWSQMMGESILSTIRKLHLVADAELFAQGQFAIDIGDSVKGAPRNSSMYYFCWCTHREILESFAPHDPLFQLELLDEGRILRVRTFCKFIQLQEHNLRTALRSWANSRMHNKVFTGLDLLDVVRAIAKAQSQVYSYEAWTKMHDCQEDYGDPRRPFGNSNWVLEATEKNTHKIQVPVEDRDPYDYPERIYYVGWKDESGRAEEVGDWPEWSWETPFSGSCWPYAVPTWKSNDDVYLLKSGYDARHHRDGKYDVKYTHTVFEVSASQKHKETEPMIEEQVKDTEAASTE